jgi:hypothetical protein
VQLGRRDDDGVGAGGPRAPQAVGDESQVATRAILMTLPRLPDTSGQMYVRTEKFTDPRRMARVGIPSEHT